MGGHSRLRRVQIADAESAARVVAELPAAATKRVQEGAAAAAAIRAPEETEFPQPRASLHTSAETGACLSEGHVWPLG